MAGECPGFIRWLHSQECACEDCSDRLTIEANHSTVADTFVAGERGSEKRMGGRRGRGQRTHDRFAFPLCSKHHGQFTRFADRGKADGYFAGWTKKQLDAWQREQSAKYWPRYEAWLAERGLKAEDENDRKRRSLRVNGMDVDAEIEQIVQHHQGENGNQLRLEIKGLCRRVASAASGGAVY